MTIDVPDELDDMTVRINVEFFWTRKSKVFPKIKPQ